MKRKKLFGWTGVVCCLVLAVSSCGASAWVWDTVCKAGGNRYQAKMTSLGGPNMAVSQDASRLVTGFVCSDDDGNDLVSSLECLSSQSWTWDSRAIKDYSNSDYDAFGVQFRYTASYKHAL